MRHGLAILLAEAPRNALSRAVPGTLDEDFRARTLSFDRAAALACATIAAKRHATGRPIRQCDCQIAAIARARAEYGPITRGINRDSRPEWRRLSQSRPAHYLKKPAETTTLADVKKAGALLCAPAFK